MRLSYTALLSLVVFLLAGCEQNSAQKAAAPSVAVVNFTRLVEESEAGKLGRTHLETVSADMQERLMGMQSGDDMAQMQMAFTMYQEAINALQGQVVAVFTEAVNATTKEVRAAKGIICVIHSEAAIDFAPEADITDAVIAELNKKQITYPASEFDLSALIGETPGQSEDQQPEDAPQTSATPEQDAAQ